MPLCDLEKGEHAIIERFEELGHVRKFLSLGLLPGTSITLLKASPAVVVRAGYSEFALDRALAATVSVRRLSARVR
jgi:Fe2+ transport system protein FeoA